MHITEEMIDNLANLSKLQFSKEEKKLIAEDLEKMIDFVNKLQRVNTDGVEPLIHMTDVVNVLRNDKIKKAESREALLEQAPHTDGVYIKVPKVIQKEEA